MASSFGQYQSGIQPVQGISEAGARIGASYERGMSALGEGLAKGIDTYYKSSAESAMIDQEAQALGSQLQQFHDIFGSNPEYTPFAEQLNQYTDKLSKIPEMSLAQKRGALNGAKVAFSQIGTQLQMFTAMKTMNEERAAAEALNPKNNPLTDIKTETVGDALRKFNKGASYAQNETQFLNDLENYKKQGVKVGDTAELLNAYRARVEQAATELSKTDPSGLAILDQVKAAKKLSTGSYSDESEYDTAVQQINTPVGLTGDALVKQNQSTALSERLAQEKAKLEELKKSKESGDYTQTEMSDRAANLAQTGVFDPVNVYGMKGLAALGKDQGLYGKITPEVAARIVQDTKGGLGAFPIAGGAILNFAYPFGKKPELTAAEEANIEDAYNKVKAQAEQKGEIWGTRGTKTAIPEQISTQESAIKSLEIQKAQAEQEAKATEATSSFVLPVQEGKAGVIGTKETEVPISPEVRNQKAIELFTKRLNIRDSAGNLVTPASVNKLFGQSNQPKVIQLPTGQQLLATVDEKGNTTYKELSQVKPEKQVVFGNVDPKTNKIGYEKPISGIDVAVRGKASSVENGDNYKKLLAKSAMTIDAMNKVIEIAKKHPAKSKLPLTLAGKEIINAQSKAIALMQDTLGLGRLSDKDVQIIMKRIPAGDTLAETPEQTIFVANLIKNDIYEMIKNTGEAYDLDVVVPSSGTNTREQDAREALTGIKK